jgi:hypothetical protein
MGINTPSIMTGKVMHKRLFPKVNAFTYDIYYLCTPLSQLNSLPIARNKFSAISFHDKDHGKRDGSSLENWARDILKTYNIDKADGDITLICMPRILGYVFNPVSFWLCTDKEQNLRAVICEVNNTFGESHSYLCVHDDQSPLSSDDILHAQKLFHVSPFLEREGDYTFRFNIKEDKIGVWIDFYDAGGNKKLITSLMGILQPMTRKNIRKIFWQYPLITVKAISLIHWQALKLIAKGIKHIKKPTQRSENISITKI